MSNAQTLFQIGTIPSDKKKRDILDEAEPEHVYPVFTYIFDTLNKHEYLDSYRCINGDLLIAVDGTEYYNSKTIHCENCNVTNHRNGTLTYSHKAIMPVVVSPQNNQVISLGPEFITKQDGAKKQDCEHEAMKRWLLKQSADLRHLGITILGDDLYCDQPICLAIQDAGFNFILVCLPESHKTLYEWIDFFAKEGQVQNHQYRQWTGKEYITNIYRFVNEVPVRDGKNALNVCGVKSQPLRQMELFSTKTLLPLII